MSNFRPNPPPLILTAKSRVLSKKNVVPKPLPPARVSVIFYFFLLQSSTIFRVFQKPYKPTYKPLSAAIPFFTSGRLNSVHEIVSASKEVGALAGISINFSFCYLDLHIRPFLSSSVTISINFSVVETNSTRVTASAAVQSSSEIDQSKRISGFPKSSNWNLDEAIVETAGKESHFMIMIQYFIHYFCRQDHTDGLSV